MSSVLRIAGQEAHFDIEPPLFQISFQDLNLGSLVELLGVSDHQLLERRAPTS